MEESKQTEEKDKSKVSPQPTQNVNTTTILQNNPPQTSSGLFSTTGNISSGQNTFGLPPGQGGVVIGQDTKKEVVTVVGKDQQSNTTFFGQPSTTIQATTITQPTSTSQSNFPSAGSLNQQQNSDQSKLPSTLTGNTVPSTSKPADSIFKPAGSLFGGNLPNTAQSATNQANAEVSSSQPLFSSGAGEGQGTGIGTSTGTSFPSSFGQSSGATTLNFNKSPVPPTSSSISESGQQPSISAKPPITGSSFGNQSATFGTKTSEWSQPSGGAFGGSLFGKKTEEVANQPEQKAVSPVGPSTLVSQAQQPQQPFSLIPQKSAEPKKEEEEVKQKQSEIQQPLIQPKPASNLFGSAPPIIQPGQSQPPVPASGFGAQTTTFGVSGTGGVFVSSFSNKQPNFQGVSGQQQQTVPAQPSANQQVPGPGGYQSSQSQIPTVQTNSSLFQQNPQKPSIFGDNQSSNSQFSAFAQKPNSNPSQVASQFSSNKISPIDGSQFSSPNPLFLGQEQQKPSLFNADQMSGIQYPKPSITSDKGFPPKNSLQVNQPLGNLSAPPKQGQNLPPQQQQVQGPSSLSMMRQQQLLSQQEFSSQYSARPSFQVSSQQQNSSQMQGYQNKSAGLALYQDKPEGTNFALSPNGELAIIGTKGQRNLQHYSVAMHDLSLFSGPKKNYLASLVMEFSQIFSQSEKNLHEVTMRGIDSYEDSLSRYKSQIQKMSGDFFYSLNTLANREDIECNQMLLTFGLFDALHISMSRIDIIFKLFRLIGNTLNIEKDLIKAQNSGNFSLLLVTFMMKGDFVQVYDHIRRHRDYNQQDYVLYNLIVIIEKIARIFTGHEIEQTMNQNILNEIQKEIVQLRSEYEIKFGQKEKTSLLHQLKGFIEVICGNDEDINGFVPHLLSRVALKLLFKGFPGGERENIKSTQEQVKNIIRNELQARGRINQGEDQIYKDILDAESPLIFMKNLDEAYPPVLSFHLHYLYTKFNLYQGSKKEAAIYNMLANDKIHEYIDYLINSFDRGTLNLQVFISYMKGLGRTQERLGLYKIVVNYLLDLREKDEFQQAIENISSIVDYPLNNQDCIELEYQFQEQYVTYLAKQKNFKQAIPIMLIMYRLDYITKLGQVYVKNAIGQNFNEIIEIILLILDSSNEQQRANLCAKSIDFEYLLLLGKFYLASIGQLADIGSEQQYDIIKGCLLDFRKYLNIPQSYYIPVIKILNNLLACNFHIKTLNFLQIEPNQMFSREDLEFITLIIANQRQRLDDQLVNELAWSISGRMATNSSSA